MKRYTLVNRNQVPVNIVYNIPLDQVFDIIFGNAIRSSEYAKLCKYREILDSMKYYSELGMFFYNIGYYILETNGNRIREAGIDLKEFYDWLCNIIDENMKP